MKTLTTIYRLEADEASNLAEFICNNFGFEEIHKITTTDDDEIVIWGTKQEDKTQKNVDNFKAFANEHNKRLRAIEIINEINELTKEAAKLDLKLD